MKIRPPQDRRAPVAPRRLIWWLRCLFALACAAGSASGQSFAPAVSYPVGSDTWGLVLADFDGDGALDIATANGAGNDVLDFLSREPEAGEPWTAVLDRCPDVNNNPSCGRLLVSQSFFQSPEFYLKGYYAYLFYRVAVGRRPEYAEIVSDMRELAGQTADEVFRKRAGHTASFARRQEFEQRYSLMGDRQYVGALLGRYQLQSIVTEDPRDPEGAAQVTLTGQQLVDALTAGTLTRAQVLRAVVQSSEVDAAEYHGAFVSMQYYGYLRRAPEEGGYQSWLGVIKQDPSNVRVMVNGFANSQEYLLRFGRP